MQQCDKEVIITEIKLIFMSTNEKMVAYIRTGRKFKQKSLRVVREDLEKYANLTLAYIYITMEKFTIKYED